MANLLQSSATTATTTPQYYTDYLSNLASKGTAAGAAVDPSAWAANANQNQAFNNVSANVGNYQPGLTTAGGTLANAANTDITGAAQPLLTAGTGVSGLDVASGGFSSGLAQNTGAAVANPYLTAGTTTSGLSSADPYLTSGTNTSGLSVANPYLTSGSSSAADIVGGYMNPYVQNVVDQIRVANQQNIAQNLSPAITSGAVGGGQFGSQRGANALALGISNADIGALTQQNTALQSGYSDALKAAQQQRLNQIAAGTTAGNLQTAYNTNEVNAGNIAGNLQTAYNTNQVNAGNIAGTLQGQQATTAVNAANAAGALQNTANANKVAAAQIAANAANEQGLLGVSASQQQAAQAKQLQDQGLLDTNALSTLGGTQQTIAQNAQLMPLDVLGKQAAVMTGAQLPVTTTQTMTGSPLSAIAGLGSGVLGLTTANAQGKTPLDTIQAAWNKLTGPSASPPGATSTAGTTTDSNGVVMQPGVYSDNAGGFVNYLNEPVTNTGAPLSTPNNPVQDVQSTDPNYDAYDYQSGSQGI